MPFEYKTSRLLPWTLRRSKGKKVTPVGGTTEGATKTFTKQSKTQQGGTDASFIVAYNITNDTRVFVNTEFLKNCMLDVVEIVCPENKKEFEDISLSRTTMRRIEHMEHDLCKKHIYGLRSRFSFLYLTRSDVQTCIRYDKNREFY